ncbi:MULTISPECIES: helix-turn-helix domain-containing protein [unclassified Bradyrhizobium]|uniref:helix-turn-helix domain-containing protein n=1 Tax=unclassified Bradyrhizobium TaxID=2631580 RepID=UPI0023061773|nr:MULTISPECIES: helix-turn-helix transcriptional regulator [unclassified Bradyrhizobium]MDA9451179.1 transcriptional regulator [Bradyrhizobium sp. CCBAU 21360]MDA9457558.1 transcriptional regulator [Bradyrhizobium sp. CCBAU 21359]
MAKDSMTSPVNYLARNVRRLRLERGLSQEKLAADASTRQALISNIEAGSGNPTLKVMIRIARALKVDFAELFVAS